jgi:hypothetical protein
MGGTVYHNRDKLKCLSNTWGHGHEDVATIEVMAHASVALPEGKEMGMRALIMASATPATPVPGGST